MAADAIIIGGGFYGCCLADYISKKLESVVLLERESQLLSRASYGNQARLHQGYHYPRSWRTAARSRENYNTFIKHFPESIVKDFRHIYCIAKNGSNVSTTHFERFCRLIGAPLRKAPNKIVDLFSSHLIAGIYEVDECAFDAHKLKSVLKSRLAEHNVSIRTNTAVSKVSTQSGNEILVELSSGEKIAAKWVFNCTYSGLNYVKGMRNEVAQDLKHEVTEMALIELPDELHGLGITLMDGPFFSVMPFPARNLNTLSHVRYTPHFSWIDQGLPDQNPYLVLERYNKKSNYPFMIRDAARYLPAIRNSRYVESIFEVKTLLQKTELDDARPILFDHSPRSPRLISILGGKIDNIFDIIEFLKCHINLK